MYTTTTQASARNRAQLRPNPLDFAAIFAGLLLLALLTVVVTWQFWHVDRIFTGATIGGVPVGGLTRGEAVAKLSAELQGYPLAPVSVYAGERQWPLTMSMLQPDFDVADAVNRSFLLGRDGSITTRLGQQLSLALRGYEITLPLTFDDAELRYAVSQIAADVRRPGRPQVAVNGLTIPAQPGVDVDEDATVAAITRALQEHAGGAHVRVPLATVDIAPPQLTSGGAAVDALAGPAPLPLVLQDARSGTEIALDPEVLRAVAFSTTPLRIDRDVLRAHLRALAEEIDVPARDARLRFNPATGGLTVIRSSQPGRQLDIDATMTAVETALVDGRGQAELVLVETQPRVDMNRVAEMGIRELVAGGTTYFAGSSAARIRNIEVAAEKFDGVVIPPGEIFSFNEFVEDVTAANGFEDSLIIWGDRTAVGVGGGVCQVSTTVFRAAYAAGLPIVERYNHGYVVSWYGEPGMDATIYTPTVDFRFRNDTGAYLLIEPVVDSAQGVITFNLYGTRPERQVTIGEPVVTDVKAPEPPVYEVDEDLATGEKQQVEWEQEGMTVTVTRTIVENGTTRADSITSVYQPWRAMYLIGPGTLAPQTDPGDGEDEEG